MPKANAPLPIAVLISGTGSNMVAIAKAIEEGALNASIKLVVSSNAAAKGIQKAQDMGLETLVFQKEDYANPQQVEERMVEAFAKAGVECVIMAGYMRKVTPVLLGAFENKVINLHPALLPKFPGAHAIQEAFEAGEKVTGITIHIANEAYDEGPIIFQRKVPVLDGDTLEALEERIHAAEHASYPQVIELLAQGRVRVEDGKVRID